jgi:hypothetical protein
MASFECPDLSDLVCNLKGLRGLEAGPRSLNTVAIRHLASTPYLHYLQLPNSAPQLLRSLASLPSHPFKPLRRLVMRGASFASWPALLKRLQPH